MKASVSIDVLSAFGFVVFERSAPGELQPLGEVPTWLSDLGWDPVPERASPEDRLSFLDNFLLDAEAFWDSEKPGFVRSGVWSERIDGAEVPFEAFAINSHGNAYFGIEKLGESFEERRALLQRARETSLGLESLLREVQRKEVLLHCIVHDLRAPLSGVVGALSLLQSGSLEDEKREMLIEMGLRQARKQDALIGQVLEAFAAEIADLEAFDLDPERAPRLLEVVPEVLERFRPPCLAKGVQLECELSSLSEDVQVASRTDRLERVLSNLLENALRHTPPGSTIRLEARNEGETVRVSVTDEGPGVPEDEVATLFDRFAQGKEMGGSMGLGLYFCRIMVERWGGTIGYAPRSAGGAEFWLSLPRLPARSE